MTTKSEFEFLDIMSPIEESQGSGMVNPDFAPHVMVLNALSMAPYLRSLREYPLALNVLIVDDGVASQLTQVIRQDGKTLYCLDPQDGIVAQFQSWRPFKYNIQGFPPQSSFSRLPRFDLVLTGCHGIQAGKLYTSGSRLIGAFQELQRVGAIGDHTCVVAMVNQYQYDHQPPYDRYFIQSRWAIVTGIGVTRVDCP
jgi:hypothetical protein